MQSLRSVRRRCAFVAVLFLAGLAWPSEGWSRAPKRTCVTEGQVIGLLQEWTDKLQEAWRNNPVNPDIVVQTYARDGRGAILVPTCTNGPLIGTDAITGYFTKFLVNKPVAQIDARTRTIRIQDCNSAFAAGLYDFTLTGATGQPRLAARYTYIYQRQSDRSVRIAHHHSSLQPESSSRCPVPTQ